MCCQPLRPSVHTSQEARCLIGLVFDAVRVRLIEIGEAIKDIDPQLLATEANIAWRDVARMRDHLAHRYFDTDHAIYRFGNCMSIYSDLGTGVVMMGNATSYDHDAIARAVIDTFGR